MNLAFGFFLVPGFSLVALSCAIDVLRAANIEMDEDQLSWHLIGVETTRIASSSGISLDVEDIKSRTDCDIIAICGGERSHLFNSPRALNWLKRQAVEGKSIGSISDGAFIAADAGLFDRCKSTIHWKCQTAYRENHPGLDIRTSILEIDGNRFSCAGGTASLDLMLQLIMETTGPEIVGKIADNYFHDIIRGDEQAQHMTNAFRYAGRTPVLSDALLIMESNLEAPLTISEIAELAGTSSRQLDRLFRKHLNTAPSTHYRDLRIFRACGLLKQSRLTVAEIAVGCGFQSSSHLSKHFKPKMGTSPLKYRMAR